MKQCIKYTRTGVFLKTKTIRSIFKSQGILTVRDKVPEMMLSSCLSLSFFSLCSSCAFHSHGNELQGKPLRTCLSCARCFYFRRAHVDRGCPCLFDSDASQPQSRCCLRQNPAVNRSFLRPNSFCVMNSPKCRDTHK